MAKGVARPFKYCKCGTLCATGYCSECRARDATVKTIAARERMDRAAVGSGSSKKSNKKSKIKKER
ncbi:hypothetical protein DFR58_101121 [Anaerobacterium chartisolvens]|uniref:Uncharacterized protein n=1 Tax=Anaerobacterium chartisolvens TaxID=1297424 RepID=A0A369BH84_9FIRM|nr:hypothetical protein [Anaerobacterium chartisolvens]RCX20919.1 hypothetical protein DFR58_101121 [Anaerobacterium chartisolvens]